MINWREKQADIFNVMQEHDVERKLANKKSIHEEFDNLKYGKIFNWLKLITHYIQWGGIHLHNHIEGCRNWNILKKHQCIDCCCTETDLGHKLEASHLN
jgi:hypothetical protein